MDGQKDLIPDWNALIANLRQQGEQSAADAIEQALNEGKKVQAVKLARRFGVLPDNGNR